MPAPKISIIIPLYNAKNYIGTCIDSILKQSFQDFEIILVDDASRDGGLQFVGQSYKDESRLKILQHAQNLGEAESRNDGLALAKGKYIYFMDDNDALLPKCLETFFTVAEQTRADVVHMTRWIDALEENFTLSSKTRVKRRNEKDTSQKMLSQNLHDRLMAEFVESGSYATPWLNFFRHDFLYRNAVYFPKVTRQSDQLHLFAALCLAKNFCKIDAGLYIRRISDRNTALNASPEVHLRESIRSMPNMLSYMEEIFSKDIVSPISRRDQIQLEVNILQMTLESFIIQSYRKDLELDVIDSILIEEFQKISLVDPLFVRMLFHAFSFSFLARSLLAQRLQSMERK